MGGVFFFVDIGDFECEVYVFGDGYVWVQCVVLEDYCDVVVFWWYVGDVVVVDQDVVGVDFFEVGEYVE